MYGSPSTGHTVRARVLFLPYIDPLGNQIFRIASVVYLATSTYLIQILECVFFQILIDLRPMICSVLRFYKPP